MYIIVPREVTQNSARVFVGRFKEHEPPLQRLSLAATPLLGTSSTRVAIAVTRWKTLCGGDEAPIYTADVMLESLEPNTQFNLELLDDYGTVLATGEVETLPIHLPRGSGHGAFRPFTLWASSCFYGRHADENLDTVVKRLLADARYRPHLKLLLGDQVYLDYPQYLRYLTSSEAELKSNFNASYTMSWTHPAFARLLSSSGTLCFADDHEFWNNHPNPPLSAWSWVRSQRFWQGWRALARERFDAIQGGRRTHQLELTQADTAAPALSCFFADTAIDRERARRFMSTSNMAKLCAWVRGLRCPGVLTLGQPLHSERGDEWSQKLPGFSQFHEELVPALESAPRDLVVIAGDAHFGRIATVRVKSGQRIIEVVSSPLALVNPLVGGPAVNGPAHFRATPNDPGTVSYQMKIPSYRASGGGISEEHGLTLSFAQVDQKTVSLVVQAWFSRGAAPAAWNWSTELS